LRGPRPQLALVPGLQRVLFAPHLSFKRVLFVLM